MRDRGELAGRAESDDGRNVLGARAHALLVPAARDERPQLDALVDDERAGALRAVNLVCREAHRVHVQRTEIYVDLAERLHGVGVHPRPRRARRSPTAATCWITPVSLFASITETMPGRLFQRGRHVVEVDLPLGVTASLRTFHPRRASSCVGFATHGCSIALTATVPA